MSSSRNSKPDIKNEDSRGRRASRPREIPRKGWGDVLLRVKDEQSDDNVSIIAAGVAFYWFLAIFPALAAAVSIYALAADPAQLQQQIDTLGTVLPPEAYRILQAQLTTLVQHSGGALGLGMIFGILLTIWSANKGMKALITALNIVYDEQERRGFIMLNAVSLLFTFCAILLGLVAISLLIAVPALIGLVGFSGTLRALLTYLRWPLLGVFLAFGLALAYRFFPDRDAPKWRWVSWGSISATLLWLAGSVLFSLYVANFGSFGKTYGSMGAVAILLLWFYLTAYVILLGAELNAEMEHQTREDSTVGRPEPLGRRRAYVADTTGESRV
ncbi:MAG: YihY/virulence factor BrkB family protein [Desulfobacterales bacterium]